MGLFLAFGSNWLLDWGLLWFGSGYAWATVIKRVWIDALMHPRFWSLLPSIVIDSLLFVTTVSIHAEDAYEHFLRMSWECCLSLIKYDPCRTTLTFGWCLCAQSSYWVDKSSSGKGVVSGATIWHPAEHTSHIYIYTISMWVRLTY